MEGPKLAFLKPHALRHYLRRSVRMHRTIFGSTAPHPVNPVHPVFPSDRGQVGQDLQDLLDKDQNCCTQSLKTFCD